MCTDWAHINVDETGAPERILATKLIDLPCPDAKLVPEQLAELAHVQGDQHHVQPGVVSITQATELGTLYTADEIAALCDQAHRMGMLVHLDGARIANATAALGGTPRRAAVVHDRRRRRRALLRRHQERADGRRGRHVLQPGRRRSARSSSASRSTQLPSKMRFLAAQFNAILHDDLWIDLADRANGMATELYDRDGRDPRRRPRPVPRRSTASSPACRADVIDAAAGLVLLLGLGRCPGTRCAG